MEIYQTSSQPLTHTYVGLLTVLLRFRTLSLICFAKGNHRIEMFIGRSRNYVAATRDEMGTVIESLGLKADY